MIDATVLWGNGVAGGGTAEELFALGATEVLASPVPAGRDRTASLERTLRLLAQVSRSISA